MLTFRRTRRGGVLEFFIKKGAGTWIFHQHLPFSVTLRAHITHFDTFGEK